MFWKKKPTIVTHSGRFHADDLFATAMLLEYFGGKAKVIRTTDQKIIDCADFVLDIGGVYDPEKKRFDHHQGNVGARENAVPYAATGLVWKHFGEKIAGSKKAADLVDSVFVAQIDIFDTGFLSPAPLMPDLYPYSLDDIATAFSKIWTDPEDFDVTDRFMFFLPFARAIIRREAERARSSIEGEEHVKEIYEKSPDKRVIIFDRSYPFDYLRTRPEPLFIVFPHARGGFAVGTIRKNKHEYGNRKDLPKEWAGKSGEDMAKVSGVPDATFCHLSLFIAAARSKEGAIALAKKALEA